MTTIVTRMDIATAQKLRILAKATERSQAGVIRWLIKEKAKLYKDSKGNEKEEEET